MAKYRNVKIIQCCLGLCCLFATPMTVRAIESPGEIGFKENNESVQPLDPEEIIPIEPNQPPTNGPLSLNYASNIYFGKHKMVGEKQEFFALPDTITHKEDGTTTEIVDFVQLTDNRATGSGWSLKVKQNGPLRNAKGTTIKGALISIDYIEIASLQDQGGQKPELFQNIVLDSEGDEVSNVANAPTATGMGTWTVYLGNEKEGTSSVRLSVPKNEPKESGMYTTTLTWMLEDVL